MKVKRRNINDHSVDLYLYCWGWNDCRQLFPPVMDSWPKAGKDFFMRLGFNLSRLTGNISFVQIYYAPEIFFVHFCFNQGLLPVRLLFRDIFLCFEFE